MRSSQRRSCPFQHRATVVLIVAAAVWLAALGGTPAAFGAAGQNAKAPAVRMRSFTPPGGQIAVACQGGSNTGSVQGTASQSAEGEPVIIDTGMRFTMAGVTCDVPKATGAVSVRLRSSLDGRTWSYWIEAPLEVAGEAGAAPQAFIDPLWTGAARYVQVCAEATASRAPRRLAGARLITLDPTLESVVAPAAMAAASASATTGAPTIITRSQWGADESLRDGSPSYATPKMIFIHHTAGANDYTQAEAAALVRGIYAYHTKSLGWSDIGYNFLVDRFGKIYEGRYGGVSRGTVGAHVLGFNTGSVGVSVMGTFTDAEPPAAALRSLEKLLSWKLGVHGLAATGTAKLTCGATEKYAKGATVQFPVIAGHRQANYTECPGSAFYALLPTVRTSVAALMGASAVSRLETGSPMISPNGDGVLDSTDLTVTLSTAASWKLILRNASNAKVASWSGQGTSAKVTWAGDGSSGTRVPDGAYTAKLTATGTSAVSVAVTVDTVAPGLSRALATPAVFSPNGDGAVDKARLDYTPAEACDVRVGIKNAGGKVLRWLHGWRARGMGGSSVNWDGSDGSATVHSGTYRFTVERRDDAGNVARQAVKAIVDLYQPRLYAPRSRSTTLGAKAKLTLKAVDPFSAKVDIRFTVKNADGATVASVHPGSVPTGKSVSVTWKPKAVGVYTITYRATDLGANRERSSVTTRLTVRSGG